MAPLDYRSQLLTLGRVFSQRTGRSLQTISMKAHGNRQLFQHMEEGRSLTVDSYLRMKDWFAENWPVGLPWPEGVHGPGRVPDDPAFPESGKVLRAVECSSEADSRPLTNRQVKFLRILIAAQQAGQPSPPHPELKRRMGYRSSGTLSAVIEGLEARGYIRRPSGLRTIEVLRMPPDSPSPSGESHAASAEKSTRNCAPC